MLQFAKTICMHYGDKYIASLTGTMVENSTSSMGYTSQPTSLQQRIMEVSLGYMPKQGETSDFERLQST